MTGLYILLAVLGVLDLLGLFILIMLSRDIISTKHSMASIQGAIAGIGNKLNNHDIYLSKIGASFSEFATLMETVVEKINREDRGIESRYGAMYRTIDGKYASTSLEGLIDKIKGDGVEGNYLSEEELENLRKLFENENDRDDNDDDSDFNPDKGKF